MNYGLHLTQCTIKEAKNYGKFYFVGNVPVELMTAHAPTAQDVIAGRVTDGKAYKQTIFNTAEEAITKARETRATLCKAPACTCRKLF